MSVSAVLGELRSIDVPAGTIDYRESGSGPPVVFVHGVGVNGDLWRNVAPELAGEHRCIVPDLPFGAHSRPLRDDAELSLPGMARIVADFIAALGLEEVAVVANDTGGAVAQWLVGHHPDRSAGWCSPPATRSRSSRPRHSATSPAIVLWADGDKIFPRDHGRRLAELLPQGRFEIVPGSRTFIPEDQPEKLTAAMREFLAERQHATA
jgi:pimeloyl-ACP methyl ester carboxylesterase